MADTVVELKKHVKQLNTAVTEKIEEVRRRQIVRKCVCGDIRPLHAIYQDILAILGRLKKDFDVTEQILRVSASRLSLHPLSDHHPSSRKARSASQLGNFASTNPSRSPTLQKISSRNGRLPSTSRKRPNLPRAHQRLPPHPVLVLSTPLSAGVRVPRGDHRHRRLAAHRERPSQMGL